MDWIDALICRIAMLEILVEALFIEEFAKHEDPVKAVNAYAEALREAFARKAKETSPPEGAVATSASLDVFLDRVTEKLRRRGAG